MIFKSVLLSMIYTCKRNGSLKRYGSFIEKLQ